MKKLLLLLFIFGGFSMLQAQEQNNDTKGFRAGFAAGYLSEIDAVGGSVDLIYQLNEKWSIANTNLFTVSKLPSKERLKWFSMDINARYNVYDKIYMLAGGQFLYETFIEKVSVNEFATEEQAIKSSNFGANIGAGYIYHLLSNANVFVELKYTLLANKSEPLQSSSYLQARIGMVFDL